MIKVFCDMCESEIPKEYDWSRKRFFEYGSSYDGVETNDDTVWMHLCDKCELKIYRVFIRHLVKEGKIEKPKLKGLAECKGFVHRIRSAIGYYTFGKFVKDKYFDGK